jgi:hypothetical protein
MIVKLKLYNPQCVNTGYGTANVDSTDRYLSVYPEREHDYVYLSSKEVSHLTSQIIDSQSQPRAYSTVITMKNGHTLVVEGTVMSVMNKLCWD